MNDADIAPSPNKFCNRFGMRNAAVTASAAGKLPKKCAKTWLRTSPVSRLARMPIATSEAARPPLRSLDLSDKGLRMLPGRLSHRVEERRPVPREQRDHIERPLLRLVVRIERAAQRRQLRHGCVLARLHPGEQTSLQSVDLVAGRPQRPLEGRRRHMQ